MNEWHIDTVTVSVRKKVAAGKITMRQAAEELYDTGWIPSIDEDMAKRVMDGSKDCNNV